MVRQKGFALVQILLVIAILCIIAFVAWRIITVNSGADNAQSQAPTSTQAISGNDVPAVQNVGDLTTLEQQLNSAQVDDDSIAELDTETTF